MKKAVNINMETENPLSVNLRYLFLTFLKIGTVSFGGHIALIAVIQREMVEKDKAVDADVIIDGISIASLLPGPVAVNVVAYIGYHLQGKKGAAVSMLGILLPACTLMFIISWSYFNYAYKVHLADIMVYTAGAVSAIILSTGANLYTKEIHGKTLKTVICAAAVIITIFAKGYFITLVLLIAGGLSGYFFNPDNKNKLTVVSPVPAGVSFKLSWPIRSSLVVLGTIEIGFLSNAAAWFSNVYFKLISVFSGISLSLFGGGYVMVPIMQSLIVSDLKWLNNQQFVDSITFSQVTPGPILISALFVGYKLAGFFGGLLAIAAIFIPSATLMLIVADIFKRNKQHQAMQRILAGIKPVVVGMIIASAILLLRSLALDKAVIAITMVTFVLSFRFKVSPVYLILGVIFLGFIFS
jgi:chromate transporter